MHKDISAIEFTFENLDYIKIPRQYFMRISIETSILLELLPEANWEAWTFSGDVHSLQYEIESLFERIARNDVTGIVLHYNDGHQETIWVPWEDMDVRGAQNCLQSTVTREAGGLSIRIGKL